MNLIGSLRIYDILSSWCACFVLISNLSHLWMHQVSAFPSFGIIPRIAKGNISSLAGTISFQGDSSATLVLDANLESVQSFLQSSQSDMYLLGTETYAQREDGLWDCQQPIVDFIGLSLQPVFVNRLDREPPSTVTISIVDARTDIVKNPNSPANRVVANLMKTSKFVGKSRISVSSTKDRGCQLSIDLNLTLQIPLPPFLPLPPGFNKLGSAIVRTTGKSRTKKLLKDLQEAFEKETS